MAPKAVDARKRFNRNGRFRGHGPLLQQRGRIPRSVAHPQGDIQGAPPLLVRHAGTPPRATGPRGGHGPLLRKRTISNRGRTHVHDGDTPEGFP
jgi:hypothetical protein